MEHTELSLGPPRSILSESTNSSSTSESDAISRRKRKQTWSDRPLSQTGSIELQLDDPLPLDWEQCLDLHSGDMYYLNRRTMKKSWSRPEEEEQHMDLELNISTLPSSGGGGGGVGGKANFTAQESKKQEYNSSSSGTMVALVCANCHLLVMLCKSSPSCPNCKHVHSLLPQPAAAQRQAAAKTLETLSLLS